METIEVHSKDYLVRWIHAVPGSKITWKVIPTKHSIDFGIYGQGNNDWDSKTIVQKMSQTVGTTAQRLEAAGCTPLAYNGFVRVETKEVLEGSVQTETGHMVAFVFDNTFSKSYAKHVEFSFHVDPPRQPRAGSVSGPHGQAAAAAAAALYSKDAHAQPSGATPHDGAGSSGGGGAAAHASHEPHPSQHQFPQINSSSGSHSTLQGASPAPAAAARERADSEKSRDETESVKTAGPSLRHRQSTLSSTGGSDNEPVYSMDGRYVTGFLQKKRRKQFQGFARRYFSLDKHMGLLNYYLNARSRSLRGVMPLRLADITVDPKSLQLTLDSGMEKWTLKAGDITSFESWSNEFKSIRSTGIHDSDSESEADPAAIYDQSAWGGDTEVPQPTTPSSGQALAPNRSALSPLDELKFYIGQLPGGSEKSQLEKIHDRLWVSSLAGHDDSGQRTPRPAATTVPSSATITTHKDRSSPESVKPRKPELKHLVGKSKQGIAIGATAGFFIGSLLGSFVTLVVIITLSACLGGSLYVLQLSDRELFYGKETPYQSPSIPEEESHHDWSQARPSPETPVSNEPRPRPLSEDEDDLSGDSGAEDDLPVSNNSVSYVPQKLRNTAEFQVHSAKQLESEQAHAQEYAAEDPEVAAVFRKFVEKNKKAHEDARVEASSSTSAKLGPPLRGPEPAATLQDGKKAPSTAPSAATGPAAPTTGAAAAAGGAATAAGDAATETDGAATAAGDAPAAGTAPAAARGSEDFSAETSLYPLPHGPVHRRTNIMGPKQPPPSLLAMLKKARDPNGMVAPVTANEPLTGLEYTAEIFENSSLLDAASHAQPKSHLRVMLVAVFAVARLSGIRSKERALRKPFTPLLGETFEMVREDRGLRFVAEKVMHKPEVIATQTESTHWTAHFTSRPHSKMWAKTVQITDVGHFNVTFPDGESISYINPELFIRNILAGERYLEPSGSFTVESSAGHKYTATVEFKSKGMFGGRSEEVKLTCGDLVYEGKWSEAIYNKGKVVWTAKPLVADAHNHYGWPVFAAQLNEITPMEDKDLPPNDSRLRPDLRNYENQNIDKAEELKLRLEQHQRERRKELETAGKQHEPFFFIKSNDEQGHYMLHKGKNNYWVRREAKDWSSIPNWFQ